MTDAPDAPDAQLLTALRECIPSKVGRLDLAGRTLAARVIDVYDADTITVVVPVAMTEMLETETAPSSSPSSPSSSGTHTHTHTHTQQHAPRLSTVRVRIMDIDANEMRGGTEAQRLAAVRARDFLIDRIISKNGGSTAATTEMLTRPARQALFAATPCIVTLHCDRFDKYGRVLAHVLAPSDGADYADEMLDAGIVKAYVMRA